jgi:hypothetical protein
VQRGADRRAHAPPATPAPQLPAHLRTYGRGTTETAGQRAARVRGKAAPTLRG